MACPHRPDCPGCDFHELENDVALTRKRERVVAALARYPSLSHLTIAACAGTDERRAYRTRAKWVVEGDRIGLFGDRHVVVDTPECEVAPPEALEVARRLRVRPAETDAHLTGLDVRVTETGEVAAVLIVEAETPEQSHEHAIGLATFLRAELPSVGVAASWHRPGAHTVLGGRPEVVVGKTTLRDRIGLVAARFPAGAFSQAHRGQTAVLHGWLRDAVRRTPNARVVDLYAGTGGLGLAVADLAGELVLVEPFEPAAAAARAEADPGTLVLAAHAEDALEDLPPSRAPTVVILDPPRTGLTGDAIRSLVRLHPESILYISCEPTTLARDLGVLASHGYRAADVRPIDLMPGTSQVEAFVALQRGMVPALTVIGESQGRVVVDKPPFFPTTPHPEWAPKHPVASGAGSSAVDVMRRRDPALQPAHRIDAGTSGVLVFARAGSVVLDGATKTYTALVRGIVRPRGTIRLSLDDRGERLPAETFYERIAVVGTHSLVRARLGTGRTHQIRRHFEMIGHPVLGDPRYGDRRSNQYFFSKYGLSRPFLHATRIAFLDGVTFDSPLAPDLQTVLDALGAG